MSGPADKRDTGSAEPEEEELAEGTLLSHLVELRQRMVRATLAVLAVFICLAPFAQQIFSWVATPLTDVLPEGSTMIVTGIASPFLTPFKTTLFVAVFIAMPVVLYQLWHFVSPGLYRKEKRFGVPLLVSSIVLFYLGVAFAYFVVFRLAFAFFISVTPESVANMPEINEYLGFILTIFFAFGLAFEVPIATFMLVWSGLTTVKALSRIRAYVFLGAFVFGMLLTPPDIISQTLLAVPIYLLYESGLVLCRVLLPEAAKQGEEADEQA
ncbi:twin-arginine translocase subunit TatC [Candidatus Rariloculus sp.]|uniref:twin-arginine translocase subunit TatC n=1 Tax=Candidatus Rariloculus sp. TaxID=3101265 RepID=UPI003D13F42F